MSKQPSMNVIEASPKQVWRPAGPRAHPRRVVWVGTDDCYGHEAVRWSMVDGSPGGTMQAKAWKAWVRKHNATCDSNEG